MKIISWNVNGLRAILAKGFIQWFEQNDADVICLQEVKAYADQADLSFLNSKYLALWHSAQKPGYSGTLILSKKEPLEVNYGLGQKIFDEEGRVIQVKFNDFTLINAYFPNSQELGARIDYKIAFCDQMFKTCKQWIDSNQNIILCGDYNIAHKPIDLTHPKANEINPGYLPQERAWMETFLNSGFVDGFRQFEKGPNHYTWWSYRAKARERNVGWRIDYFCTNEDFKDKLKLVKHQNQVMGSDHCPVELILKS